MCCERNIKGCLRWVHQGQFIIKWAPSSKERQSLRDFLLMASSRPCGDMLPWHSWAAALCLSRPESPPPPGNLPRGFSRPAAARIRPGRLWGAGWWWSELGQRCQTSNAPLVIGWGGGGKEGCLTTDLSFARPCGSGTVQRRGGMIVLSVCKLLQHQPQHHEMSDLSCYVLIDCKQ